MEKKRTITIYNDLNEPAQELLRLNARKTPEELWRAYIRMRKLHIELMGPIPKSPRSLSITRPSWM